MTFTEIIVNFLCIKGLISFDFIKNLPSKSLNFFKEIKSFFPKNDTSEIIIKKFEKFNKNQLYIYLITEFLNSKIDINILTYVVEKRDKHTAQRPVIFNNNFEETIKKLARRNKTKKLAIVMQQYKISIENLIRREDYNYICNLQQSYK